MLVLLGKCSFGTLWLLVLSGGEITTQKFWWMSEAGMHVGQILAVGFGSVWYSKLEVCPGNFRNQRVRRERVGRGLLPNQAEQERKSTLKEEHPW